MADSTEPGTILSGTGGVWRVLREAERDVVEATLRGRLKKTEDAGRADRAGPRGAGAAQRGGRESMRTERDAGDAAEAPLKLAVGDNVRLARDDRGESWTIVEILPRRSRLARRAPGGAHGERVVAANVDQVLVVFAAAKPEPHPRMLDRFLAIAEGNQIAARVVVNKVELVGEAAARARFGAYERAGYPVHYTSVKERIGLEPLRAALVGRSTALSGPSGVGKSSLVNALFPGLDLRVGEISESVNKGRHTTVGAYQHPLPEGGGFVVDTPGLREVGMWGLAPEELAGLFPELRPFVDQCRFADCRHEVEPDCAVRAAVGAGQVSRERYESYVKLREELEAERPW